MKMEKSEIEEILEPYKSSIEEGSYQTVVHELYKLCNNYLGEDIEQIKCREWWANDYSKIGSEGIRMHTSKRAALGVVTQLGTNQIRVIEPLPYAEVHAYLFDGWTMGNQIAFGAGAIMEKLKELGMIKDKPNEG